MGTHGGVTDANAHPHLSANGKIAIVHNGIIDNARALRTRLKERGFELKSETDSEVLVHMISIGIESDKARWKRSEIRLQESQEHGTLRFVPRTRHDSLCKKWLASNSRSR